MKTGVIILLGTLLTGAGVGTYLYVSNKKKKEAEALEDKKREEEASAQVSNSNLWEGLSNTQTLALQQKINAFFSSGKLSGFAEWWADTKSYISDSWDRATNYANSVVKTVESKAVGPMGFDTFKASISSIMPLKEDGLYGPKTTAAVKALQVYLNANGARLKEDGLYGDATDSATGWGIKALSGFPSWIK